MGEWATSARTIRHLAAFASVGVVLAGCSSARFGGAGLAPAQPTRQARVTPPVADPGPVEALPSGSVSSEPLAPPTGFGSSPPPTVMADVPTMPGSPRPIETMTPSPSASAPTYSPSGGSSRSAQIGGWTARDATGATCRMSLSSSPSLDLYKANSSGCANKDLARVTAWDFRDGEVYLYQPGGAVAARLKGEGGSLAGVLAKSGAPLTLTR